MTQVTLVPSYKKYFFVVDMALLLTFVSGKCKYICVVNYTQLKLIKLYFKT